MTALVQAGIPSPSVGVWYVGPVPLRAYGIIIAVGMVVALAWASRRYGRRGGDPDLLFDLAHVLQDRGNQLSLRGPALVLVEAPH